MVLVGPCDQLLVEHPSLELSLYADDLLTLVSGPRIPIVGAVGEAIAVGKSVVYETTVPSARQASFEFLPLLIRLINHRIEKTGTNIKDCTSTRVI